MSMHEFIEMDILEDAVEDCPASFWNVVQLVGQYDPKLSGLEQRQIAKKIVQGLLDKGWVYVSKGIGERPDLTLDTALTAAALRDEFWELGEESELAGVWILATSRGEASYLGGNNHPDESGSCQ